MSTFKIGERVEYIGPVSRMKDGHKPLEGTVASIDKEEMQIEIDWDWNPVGDPYPYIIPIGDVRSIEDRTKSCVYCGKRFTPPKEGTQHCIHCHYDGTYFKEGLGWDQVLDPINETEDLRAELYHTGGGCWVLSIWDAKEETFGEQDWDEKTQTYKKFVPYGCATVAYRPIDNWGPDSEDGDPHGFLKGDETDHEWTYDAGLPDKPGDPWAIVWYESEDMWQGEGADPKTKLPAYTKDMIEFVREMIANA